MKVSCSEWMLHVLAQQVCQKYSGALRVVVDGVLPRGEVCHNTLG